MVTTRSAEKRATLNGTSESLALRAKLEDTAPTTESFDSDASFSSATRKSKIIVQVPPPRKRTRSTYDDTFDVQQDQQVDTSQAETSQLENVAPSEIPDSQDSPQKPTVSEPPNPLPDFAVHEEIFSTPRTRSAAARKRKAEEVSSQSVVDIDAIADANNQHKRFGSEELLETSQLIDAGGKVEGQDQAQATDITSSHVDVEEIEDDEAPEAITSRAAPAPTPSRQRKGRSLKSTPQANDHKSTSTTAASDLLNDTLTPTLKIDTSQDQNTRAAPESEDSNDSAFATAQTSRHIDVFSTPQGGTPQNQSPAFSHFDTYADNSAIVGDIPRSSLVKFTETAMSKPSRSKLPTNASPVSSIPLPRKSGNTLETFRRQNLLNRAQSIGNTRQNTNIRFQEDWPGKRRKFVVGY